MLSTFLFTYSTIFIEYLLCAKHCRCQASILNKGKDKQGGETHTQTYNMSGNDRCQEKKQSKAGKKREWLGTWSTLPLYRQGTQGTLLWEDDIWGEIRNYHRGNHVLSKGEESAKNPELRTCLPCCTNSKVVSVARMEQVRGSGRRGGQRSKLCRLRKEICKQYGKLKARREDHVHLFLTIKKPQQEGKKQLLCPNK